MRPTLATLLFLLFSLACRPMTKSPALAPDQAGSDTSAASAASNHGLQLEIRPAADSSPGGWRLPLQFTVRNTGNQPVHTCLSGNRVVHLWELDRDYGYTVTEQKVDQPGCEEALDLPPQGEHSWTEEIAVPQIAAGPVRLVGFTQVVAAEPCATGDCEPKWLTATFSPFEIKEPQDGARQARTLDVRTNLTSADLTSPLIQPAGPSGGN